MKKNGFCRAAMAGTALFLSIAVFPSRPPRPGQALKRPWEGYI